MPPFDNKLFHPGQGNLLNTEIAPPLSRVLKQKIVLKLAYIIMAPFDVDSKQKHLWAYIIAHLRVRRKMVSNQYWLCI